MDDRSIVVVGGGLVGLCTAFHLMRRGAAVTVIDRSFGLDGASSGNAGSLSPGAVLPVAYRGMVRDIPRMLLDPEGPLRVTPGGLVRHAGWLARFLREGRQERIRAAAGTMAKLIPASLAKHTELLDAIGSSDLLRADGQLHLYPDAEARERDRFGWELRRAHGVVAHELTRGELLEVEPSIGPGYTAGVFLPHQGMIVDPGDYVGRLRGVLRQSGATLVEDEVRTVETGAGGKVRLVGARQTLECEEMVLCAGAWSADVVRRLGVRIPLANQRGFHVSFADSGVALQRVVVIADRKVFVTPMRRGLRAAGTVEITPLSAKVDMRRAEALVGHVQRVWPQVRTKPRERWSGERPCLPDSLPVMGPCQGHPNVWFNFGHGHVGLTLSAVCGEEIAKSMAARRPSELVRLFDHTRFADA